jgi:hypothetical protein
VLRARASDVQHSATSPEVKRATASDAQCRPYPSVVEKKGYRWKRTRHSHKHKQDPITKGIKQADLDTLKQAAQEGHLVLKYLDESGFCLWSPVSYSYSRVGEQKRMEQTQQRWGKRISILGIWQKDQHFDYALAQGGFKTDSYLTVMETQVHQAAQTLAQTGQITVIVQDNGSIHTSQAAQAQWQNWQQQGLFLFMLPKYCSEMNDIETQWHPLKTHEIAGRMFDNEYDLAIAVIDGMTSRSQQGRYTLERFKFNSA